MGTLYDDDDDVTETNPAYGMISLTQFSGTSNFFGSSIEHSGGVTLKIGRGEHRRHISNDWYHRNDTIIELRMSAVQWAELISLGMSRGDGQPCTLVYTEKDGRIPTLDGITSKKEQIDDEFKRTLNKVASTSTDLTKAIIELKNKKSAVSKKELDELLSKVAMFKQDVTSNLPYVKDQFDEQMEKTVMEAKGEFEHYLHSRLYSLTADERAIIAAGRQNTPKIIE